MAAIILVMMSVTKDPLKDDDRYPTRITAISTIVLLFLAIFAYAATIFYEKPLDVMTFGKITPSYKYKPANLSWSGDSWSFAFDMFDKKKKSGSVNIMNALSIGMTTLPPDENAEITGQSYNLNLPVSKSQQEKIEYNLGEKLRTLTDPEGNSATAELKLPQYIDPPVWNKKGNFLVFTAGEEENGPRSIWGVSLQISLLSRDEKKEKKPEIEEDDESNTVVVKMTAEEIEAEKLLEMNPDKKAIYLAKKNEEKDKLNLPVGKPKTLLADFNVIIDKACAPLTHKTAWSPDGKRFVFDAPDSKDRLNLWVSDTVEQSIDQITKGESKLMPLWSPAGDKLLYVTKTDSYTYLKIADIDGKNARPLDVTRKKDKDLFPLWNSDESKVIYVKKGKFVIMNANTTNQKDLSRETLTPSKFWLTAGRKQVTLEFTDSGNIWKIFTINPNGKKNKKIFQETCETLAQPKWSYDGKYVVTGANYKKESALWRLDKNGDLKTRMYTGKHAITEIEWAPNSERVAFIVKKKEIPSMWYDRTINMEELWVVNSDATQPMYLYTALGSINHLTWDNEGKRMAFDETYQAPYFINPVTNVKVVHAIGAEKWTLLPYEFYGESPAWSNDGQVLAYISWSDFWMPSPGASRIWIAQIK